MTATSDANAPLSARVGFAVGAGGAVIGLLPWLVGGARLPLQNLWATRTLPDDMPFSLLPVSQYYATSMLALLLIGGVVAGLGIRFLVLRRGGALWPAAAGVTAVHAVAVVQSFLTVGIGLNLGSGGTRAMLYFVGMLGGTVIAALLAQVAFWMTARGSVAVAALGVALAAVPFGDWVVFGIATVTGPVHVPPFLGEVERWLPAVVVGVALAWCGVRPVGRLGVWGVGLLALWILPALVASIRFGLGSRALFGDLPALVGISAQLFPVVLAEAWLPVLVAAVIGAIGTTVRRFVRPSAPRAPGSPVVAR